MYNRNNYGGGPHFFIKRLKNFAVTDNFFYQLSL